MRVAVVSSASFRAHPRKDIIGGAIGMTPQKPPALTSGGKIFLLMRRVVFCLEIYYNRNQLINMTKYILHGGRTRNKNNDNLQYFLETINIPKEKINLLIVLFAGEPEFWNERFEHYKQIFLDLNSGKQIDFVLADPSVEIFTKQIQAADIVFILGGETIRLMSYLKNILNLKELFKDKTISGSSAGANFLSKYYYTINGKEVRPGLGILDIKTFPHYDPSLIKELEELKNHGEDLPIYTMEEKKFSILED